MKIPIGACLPAEATWLTGFYSWKSWVRGLKSKLPKHIVEAIEANGDEDNE